MNCHYTVHLWHHQVQVTSGSPWHSQLHHHVGGVPSALINLSYTGCWHMSLPVASTVSSISGIYRGDSSLLVYSSQVSSLGWFDTFGGVMDVPHLPSIKASNVSLFFCSTLLCISSTCRGRRLRRGTAFPLALSTHWHISLPSPVAGPRTRPRPSLLKGNSSLFSLK